MAANKVKVRLMKDNKSYKNDVFVAVNGECFMIKRGVTVDVPDYVAEALENSMAQDGMAMKLMEELQESAKADALK